MSSLETTNGMIARVLSEIDTLINWADSDVEHALENEARDTALEDRRRAKTLRRARELISQCKR